MIRLNVPYREKDEAKALGARWNPAGKFWYCEGELTEGLRRWYREEHAIFQGAAKPEGGAADGNPVPTAYPAARQNPIRTAGNTDTSAAEEAHMDTGVSCLDSYLARFKTVSQVNDMIQSSFRNTLEFQSIMVKGEVTDFNGHRGNHYYFSIKDQESLLPCFMWETTARAELKFELKAGQQVAIVGSLELYRAKGRSQLIVRQIANIGEGAANAAYLQLKARLEAEGLFDEIHKKPIPKHPKAVGIVTSKDGQAIRDICKVAAKRNPYVQLILYHVNVQGKNAVNTIIEGIQALDAMHLDTIIVGRGGGSDEELVAYNDETIARTVFAAQTPIVSAVGHEGHRPLIDFVADKRAATPTEAAEETVPDVMADIQRLKQLQENISIQMYGNLHRRLLLLDAKVATLKRFHPRQILNEQQNRLEMLSERFKQLMQENFARRDHRLDVLTTQLHGLSPTAKLVKGFGYITHKDIPVASVTQVTAGDELQIQIHDGKIHAAVLEIQTPVQDLARSETGDL